MILPDKYITVTESYIGLGALLLNCLQDKKLTVDELWKIFNKKYCNNNKIKHFPTFQKFIYVLDFMFAIGFILYTDEGEIYNENLAISN